MYLPDRANISVENFFFKKTRKIIKQDKIIESDMGQACHRGNFKEGVREGHSKARHPV